MMRNDFVLFFGGHYPNYLLILNCMKACRLILLESSCSILLERGLFVKGFFRMYSSLNLFIVQVDLKFSEGANILGFK
jgi:hypothetical protein